MAQESPSNRHAADSYHAQAAQGKSASINIYATSPPPKDLNRHRLLAKVHTFWITGVLEQSLNGTALIELGLQEQFDAIINPWRLIAQPADPSVSSLPSDMHITQVYDQAEGELLILGAPGAGKTTLLLQLTRDLLTRAQHNQEHPMPIIFNLSSWATKRLPLNEWLVEELVSKYQVPPNLGREWVTQNQILPLLDGLDEVKAEHRAACVEAINTYRREHSLTPLVVSCRRADYDALGLSTRLCLHDAFVVEPLTPDQIDSYLASGGEKLTAVREALRTDPDLQEMATAPLMLSVLTQAYAGRRPDDLVEANSPQLMREQLFTTYVERMLQHRGAENQYTPQQVKHWLSCLAQQMSQQSQTEFYLERMQPAWLASKWQRFSYSVLVRGCIALLIGLMGGLAFVLYSELLTLPGNMLTSGLPAGLHNMQSSFSSDMLTLGLTFGALSGLIYGLMSRVESDIKPAEIIRWSWGNIWQRLGRSEVGWIGLVFGVLGTLLGVLDKELFLRPSLGIPIAGLLLAFFGGLLFGVVRKLMDTLSGNAREEQPLGLSHQGIGHFAHNGVLIRLIPGLVIGLIFGLLIGLLSWLVAGVSVADGRVYQLGNVLLIGLKHGLISGTLIGVLSGLVLGITSRVERRLQPVRFFVWLWGSIWQHLSKSEALTKGLVAGLIFGLLSGLHQTKLFGLSHGLWVGVVDGLLCGLTFGLFSVLVVGLSSNMVEEQTLVRPNQGIRRSALNSVRVGLIFGLLAWLIFGPIKGMAWGRQLSLGLNFGLIGGLGIGLLSALMIGLPNGGMAYIQHRILRLLLWRAGSIPWRYTRFLDYSAEHILLRKVGGGYIFIHRLLLEHFASRTTGCLAPSELAQANLPEICTCGYQDSRIRTERCPHCGKPREHIRVARMQDLPLAPSSLQIAERGHWLGRVFNISPFAFICTLLVIGSLVVSCLVWDWSHHFYPPPHWKVAFNDPLVKNSSISWGENTESTGTCRFTHGAYRINVWKQQWIEDCTAHKTNYSDFAFEVEMTSVKHGKGGLIFRDDAKSRSSYEFWIEEGNNSASTGSYGLNICKKGLCDSLPTASADEVIREGPNQSNLIAVVARGNNFELYVNRWLVAIVPDSNNSSSQGQIGLAANEDDAPTEIVYRHVRVWRPSP